MKANSANSRFQIKWSDLKEIKDLMRSQQSRAEMAKGETEEEEASAKSQAEMTTKDAPRNARSRNIAITTSKSTDVVPRGRTKWPNAWGQMAALSPMNASQPKSRREKSNLSARTELLLRKRWKLSGNVDAEKTKSGAKENVTN